MDDKTGEIERRYNLLRVIPAFQKWSKRDILELAQRVEPRFYAGNQVIFRQASSPPDFGGDLRELNDTAYIIDVGEVRQYVTDAGGDTTWERTLRTGEIFGQLALALGQNRSTTAQVISSDGAELFKLNAPDLDWALNRHADLWKALLRTDVSGRLRGIPLFRSLDDRLIEHYAKTVEVKEFKAGQNIIQTRVSDSGAKTESPIDALWIIDWGQVEIIDQKVLDLDNNGILSTQRLASSDKDRQDIGHIAQTLSAGNWFVTGLVKLPGALTGKACAVTDLRLLSIPAFYVEHLAVDHRDIGDQLLHHFDIQGFLEDVLKDDPAFEDLKKKSPQDRRECWRQLAAVATWEHVPSKLDVVKQGQKSTRLLILVDGNALIRARDQEGRERPRSYIARPASTDSNGVLLGKRFEETIESVQGTSLLNGGSVTGSDWVGIHLEDLRYVLMSDKRRWRGTNVWSALIERHREKEFDWLQDEEDVVWKGRRHWIILLRWPFVAFVLWGLIMLTLAALQRLPALPTAALVLAVLVSFLFFTEIGNYVDDHYVVTTLRIVKHYSFFFVLRVSRNEAPLERLQEVSIATGFLGRVFGYGDLIVQTAATIGAIVFKMVPNPTEVQTIIEAQRGRVQAGRQAELREILRTDIVKRIDVRLAPQLRERSLPESAVPPPQNFVERINRAWAQLGRRLTGAWESFRKALIGFLLWPFPGARKRALERGGIRKKKKKSTPEDQVIYRKHWIVLVRSMIFSLPLLVIATVLVITSLTQPNIPMWLPLIFWTAVAFVVLYRYLNYRNDMYILTKVHLIDVTAQPFGISERKRQTTWDKVQNATLDIPNLWANLLDYGNVKIQTAAEASELSFNYLPHPRRVLAEVFRRMEENRLAQENREAAERQRDFTEAIQVYHELLRNET